MKAIAENPQSGQRGVGSHQWRNCRSAWMAATAGCFALGLQHSEQLIAWITGNWAPEVLLTALPPLVVGMATWAATGPWAEEQPQKPSSLDEAMMRTIAVRDRLGRKLVEACERRQLQVRQSLEIGIARQLSGMAVLAGLIEKRLSESNRPEAAEIAKLKGLVERTISEARLLAAAAHPPEIETEGLEAALWKMAGAAEPYHVYCRVVQDTSCPAPDSGAALQLYRVAQLIVERAIHHGQAHHILVEMAAGPEKYLTMTITDRVGHGERLPELTEADSFELQARLRSIGASVQIEQPAGGLRLTCRVMAKGPKLQA